MAPRRAKPVAVVVGTSILEMLKRPAATGSGAQASSSSTKVPALDSKKRAGVGEQAARQQPKKRVVEVGQGAEQTGRGADRQGAEQTGQGADRPRAVLGHATTTTKRQRQAAAKRLAARRRPAAPFAKTRL